MGRWHRGALGSGGHPGAPVRPDCLGPLSSQEIMVGPQFQADLSSLQSDRHGEKCKWGLVVVGDARAPSARKGLAACLLEHFPVLGGNLSGRRTW